MDHDHWDTLPDAVQLSWAHVQQLYQDGKIKLRHLKREVLQQIHNSPTYRRTTHFKDELLAHLQWSNRILQADDRVPMPVEWDSRHFVALLELVRVLNEHARSNDSTSFSLPAVTTATCLAQLIVFFKPGGVRLRDVSLSPYCVVDRKEYYRLLTAAVVHVDATHLITNMTAAIPDCLLLEETGGSGGLAADLLLLTLTSHALYVVFACVQKGVFIKRYNYYSMVTVGFSGVVFGLKVWAGYKRGGHITIWGVPVPARFSWLPALALTHLCVPEASFPAHIAGVVAGITRAYCIEPVLCGLKHGWNWTRQWQDRGAARLLGTADPAMQQRRQQQQQEQQVQQDWRLRYQQQWQRQRQQQHIQQQEPLLSQAASVTAASQESKQDSSGQQSSPSSSNGPGLRTAAYTFTDADSWHDRQHRQQQQPTQGAGSAYMRALVLDAALQLALAATAAGLYFILTKGSKPAGASRWKPSFWCR